jgi:flagellar hook-associated protein 2
LQNEQSDLVAKMQLLTELQGAADSLYDDLSTLGSLGESNSLSASTTNANRVSVTLNGATQAGSYTISEITSVASAASETGTTGWATSDETDVSTDGVMELALGDETYEIDLTGEGENNLEGLRDAINTLDAGVTASIVNTGTGSDPYYITLTATDTGAQTLELRETAGDTGTNILTDENQGSDAVFKLNGLSITKSDNVVSDVIEGLTFTIMSETSAEETVDLTLSAGRGSVASALTSMVSSYNSLRSLTNAQIGETAGLLSGDNLVWQLKQQMRELASYSTSGTSINNLTDLGIEFDENGEMSFDSATFYSLSNTEFNEVFDFLGSSTEGIGLLGRNMYQLSDPLMGAIHNQQEYYNEAYDRMDDQIEKIAERIELMQSSLTAKLQWADTLLASLESQQTLLDASIEGLEFTTYGKNT